MCRKTAEVRLIFSLEVLHIRMYEEVSNNGPTRTKRTHTRLLDLKWCRVFAYRAPGLDRSKIERGVVPCFCLQTDIKLLEEHTAHEVELHLLGEQIEVCDFLQH